MVGDFMIMLTVLRLLPVATLNSFNAHVDSQVGCFLLTFQREKIQ